MGEVNHYMKLYYETRMKDEADRRLVIAQREYDNTTVEERLEKKLDPPVPLAIRKQTAESFWKTESAATKEEVRADLEAVYNEELRAWEARMELPKTPQEYHQ
jgi:hypothetical protein